MEGRSNRHRLSRSSRLPIARLARVLLALVLCGVLMVVYSGHSTYNGALQIQEAFGSTASTQSQDGENSSGSQNALSQNLSDGQDSSSQDQADNSDSSENSGANDSESNDGEADDAETDDGEVSAEPLDSDDNTVDEGLVSDTSFLYEAAIADLSGADSYYDGQTVQVTGEAVGEAITSLGSLGSDDSMVHVTLYDSSSDSSVTVCMSEDDAEAIETYGSYGVVGDTVRVQGVFNLACSEHDGESDIHADSVAIMSRGSEQPDELNPNKFIPGAVAVGIGLVLLLVFWRMKEKSR